MDAGEKYWEFPRSNFNNIISPTSVIRWFNVWLIFLARVKSMPASVTSQAVSLQMKMFFCGEILIFRVLNPSWIPWEDGEWWGKGEEVPITLQVPGDSYHIHIINLSKDFYSSHYPPCLQDKELGTIAHCQFMKELFHLPSPKTQFLIK